MFETYVRTGTDWPWTTTLLAWFNSSKIVLLQRTEISKIESFKIFAIVTDHILVQMQMEITDLQNSDTEGHKQQRHGSLPENLNAM